MRQQLLLILLIPILMGSSPPNSETKGPNGEVPKSFRVIGFNSSDKQLLKNKKLKAAILMHTESDFVNAVIMGARSRFDLFGVEVSLVRYARYDSQKQIEDIKEAISLDVDIIIALIIDPESGGEVLKNASDKGIKIALLSNLPKGFQHSKDYTSIVTDDLYNMGKSLAQMMGTSLGGKGRVVWLYHDADYYVTNQRDNAFKYNLSILYPDIDIVVEQGVNSPENSKAVMRTILESGIKVDAIYAPWDEIANGVISALKEKDVSGITLFTMDLGSEVSLEMAKGGYVKGIVADLPFNIGETLANASCLGVLDRDVPSFIVVPTVKVTRSNLEQMWDRAYRVEAPIEVREALQ